MSGLRVIPAVAFLLLVSAGCGPKTYHLRLDPKIGFTYNYKVRVSGPQDMEMRVSMKATKIDGEEVVMEERIADMMTDGKPAPPQLAAVFKDMLLTVTSSRSGRVLRTEVTGVSPTVANTMKQQGSTSTCLLPERPVKIGEDWTLEADLAGKKTFGTYKFVRVEDLGNTEAAVLECTFDPSSGIKQVGPMTISVDVSTGMLLNSRMTMNAQYRETSVVVSRTD